LKDTKTATRTCADGQSAIDKTREVARMQWMAKLFECLRLDLPNVLAGNIKLPTDFFERVIGSLEAASRASSATHQERAYHRQRSLADLGSDPGKGARDEARKLGVSSIL
jgi:hypothetical protein